MPQVEVVWVVLFSIVIIRFVLARAATAAMRFDASARTTIRISSVFTGLSDSFLLLLDLLSVSRTSKRNRAHTKLTESRRAKKLLAACHDPTVCYLAQRI